MIINDPAPSGAAGKSSAACGNQIALQRLNNSGLAVTKVSYPV